MIVAIHQPNFFPWLGYFDKLQHADVFVVLDSVQFPKKQGTWMNRVQVLVRGRSQWVTVPVDRTFHGVRTVLDTRISADSKWRSKIMGLLDAGYHRAQHFAAVAPLVEELLSCSTSSIVELNLHSLRALIPALVSEPPELVRSSELGISGASTNLLVGLVQAVGGTTYLSGAGGRGYQDEHAFAAAGIDLQYQDFEHPMYRQLETDTFVPGLSVLDPLFNVGIEGTRALSEANRGCS